ncbi:MAG TPA: hypothetical protein EYO92_04450 [Candidatus Marinimicrobia bacterium]|nr:hypothetical protein [Candidatus Neomarinimicrobiota bacterium]
MKRETEPVILNPQTFRPIGSAVTLDQCLRNVMHWYALPLKEAVTWAAENPLKILSASKTNPLLAKSERNVWWKEEKEGWKVKAARSGKFLYNA